MISFKESDLLKNKLPSFFRHLPQNNKSKMDLLFWGRCFMGINVKFYITIIKVSISKVVKLYEVIVNEN